MLTNKNNEETLISIENFLSSKNKLVSTRVFLQDTFDVVGLKNIKVTRELIQLIIRLIEQKLLKKCDLTSIAHKSFVDFIKTHFSGQSIHTSVKSQLVNLMRTLNKKFGEKVLQEYPQILIKEYEQQNKEMAKSFSRTLEKLKDKNFEKKLYSLQELSNIKDTSKLMIFWSAKDF